MANGLKAQARGWWLKGSGYWPHAIPAQPPWEQQGADSWLSESS